MGEVVLGLLRHGQTDWNVEFRLQGVTDTLLNEMGIGQAADAAQTINGDSWDVVISSPLRRAQDTAIQIQTSNELPPVVIEGLLIERSFGEAEGMHHDKWRAHYGGSGSPGESTTAVPGIETINELDARVDELLDHIKNSYDGERVLAVSHGALIRRILRTVSNGELPRDGERIGNVSLSTIRYDGERWSIDEYNPESLANG